MDTRLKLNHFKNNNDALHDEQMFFFTLYFFILKQPHFTYSFTYAYASEFTILTVTTMEQNLLPLIFLNSKGHLDSYTVIRTRI